MTTLTEVMTKASEGAYGPDSEIIRRVVGLVQAGLFDKTAGPFICGTVGPSGIDGLHDGYFICPSFGADVTTIYMKGKYS